MREGKKTSHQLFGAFALVAVILLGLVIGIDGSLQKGERDLVPTSVPEQYQVLDEENGKVSDYMLNITDTETIGLETVERWLKECDSTKTGFQWLMYTDPDSWDAFLYLPALQETVGDLTNADVTIHITVEEQQILNVFLHTRKDMTHEKSAEEQLLHLAAPMRGIWPDEVRVYVDGEELNCDGMQIYD